MMTCTDYRRWLSPYVDGVLEPERRAELDDHLKNCGSCRQELDSLQGMLQTLRTLEPLPTPDLVPGIRRKLDAAPWWRELARRFTAPWPVSLPLHGLALATTALLVVVAANLPGVARWDQLAQKRSLVMAKRTDDVDALGEARLGAELEDEESRRAGDRLAASAPAARKRVSVSEAPEQREKTDQAFSGLAAAPPSLADERTDLRDNETALPLTGAGAADAGRADSAAQEEPQAVTETSASIPASPPPSGGALEPIQAQWRVADFAAAASQVSEWVGARQGWAVATNEHHLSIKLPASAVPEFLQQFTTDPPAAPDPTQPLWLTISLELVASP